MSASSKEAASAEVADRLPVLIPPGQYDVTLLYWQTYVYRGKAKKLVMMFKVVTPGEYFGAQLERHFNVKDFRGRPGRNGVFKFAARGDFVREYARLDARPFRSDTISLGWLRKAVIRVRVETVLASADQRELPEVCRYSVIREFVSVVAGGSFT